MSIPQGTRSLEREHSAPANDEILSEGVNQWQCGKPGSTPTLTVLPITAVAKLVVPKMADYQGHPGGWRLSSSGLDRSKAARGQWHWSGVDVAHGHLK